MKFDPMNPQPPVTRVFTAGPRGTPGKRKTENGKRRGRPLPSRFPFPVSRPVSYDADLRIVTDQEAVDARPLVAGVDADVGADERVRDPHRDPLQTRALQHDRVLDLAALDETVRPDRRIGSDERVPDLGARPDDGWSPDRGVKESGPRLDDDLPFHAAAGVDVLAAAGRER